MGPPDPLGLSVHVPLYSSKLDFPSWLHHESILRATTRARLRVCLVPATWGSESKAIASEGAWLVWGWGYHSFGSRCKESPFQWYPGNLHLDVWVVKYQDQVPASVPACSQQVPSKSCGSPLPAVQPCFWPEALGYPGSSSHLLPHLARFFQAEVPGSQGGSLSLATGDCFGLCGSGVVTKCSFKPWASSWGLHWQQGVCQGLPCPAPGFKDSTSTSLGHSEKLQDVWGEGCCLNI